MNMAYSHNDDSELEYREEQEFGYRADFTRRPAKGKTPRVSNKAQYSRRGSAPVSHNGIHRRRNKRFSW